MSLAPYLDMTRLGRTLAASAAEEPADLVAGHGYQFAVVLVAAGASFTGRGLRGGHDGQERMSQHREDRPAPVRGPAADLMLVDDREFLAPGEGLLDLPPRARDLDQAANRDWPGATAERMLGLHAAWPRWTGVSAASSRPGRCQAGPVVSISA